MTRTLEFFFDYGSPYSYLADHCLPQIAASHGARLVHRPMLLGGVFKATGNQSPMLETVAAKRAYGGVALRRTAERVGAPFAGNPHFPINTLMLMRTAMAARQADVFEAFHAAVYPAFWQHGLDLGDPGVLTSLLDRSRLDGSRLVALGGEAAAKDALRASTEEAIERGVFGAPTVFHAGEMYFGVDHLPDLERALSAA